MLHIIILNIITMLFQLVYHHFRLCIRVGSLDRLASSPTLSLFGGFHLGRQPLWAVLQTGLASASQRSRNTCRVSTLDSLGGWCSFAPHYYWQNNTVKMSKQRSVYTLQS